MAYIVEGSALYERFLVFFLFFFVFFLGGRIFLKTPKIARFEGNCAAKSPAAIELGFVIGTSAVHLLNCSLAILERRTLQV